MHFKIVLPIMAIAITSLAWQSPSRAADPQTTGAQGKSGTGRLASLPKAVAGCCAGAIIGAPICFVRKFPKEVSEGAHGFVGSITSDDNNKLLFIPACVLWLPVASVVTALEAPGYALKDAYTADKPFEKEQFSLGEMDQKK